MIFEIKIDDSILQNAIKTAIADAIQRRARSIAEGQVNKIQSDIDKAVENYLIKNLPSEAINTQIQKAVAEIIKERMDY